MRCYGTLLAGSALMILATSAVAGWPNKREPYEPVAIPQDITQGYSLVLLKPLAVASGKKAIYFQGGQLVEEHGIRGRAPYCRLELAKPARTALTIRPQEFQVTNVTYDERAQGPAGEQVSVTDLSLKPAKGGETNSMPCLRPGASMKADFLTPEEIAGALSGYFSIEAPQ